MALDPSIILQGRGIQLDNPLDSASKAMSLRQLANQNQAYEKKTSDENALQGILKKNVMTGPDGRATLNKQAALSEIYQSNPEKGMALESEWNKHELDKQQYIVEIAKPLAFSTTPENYSQVVQKMKEYGLPGADQMPPVYSRQFVENWQMGLLKGEDQMKQKQQAIDNNFKSQELGIKAKDAARKAAGGESLPIDKKKMVETLSTKNAGKIAIKNQIEAVMDTWDQLPEDQKVAQGRSLLKTLNSVEGADAIGSEEAKRLGSKLEYAVGNLTNSNPIQFGRDLEGFAKQARDTAKNIGSAVESNQSIIDESLGRKTQAGKSKSAPSAMKTFKTSEIEW